MAYFNGDGSLIVLTYLYIMDRDIMNSRILLNPAEIGVPKEFQMVQGRAVDEMIITRFQDATASWDR